MKQLSDGLQSHLDSGTTSMAFCWKLERTDGLVQGFTDHDVAINLEGTRYEASTGFTATEVAQNLGLAIDSLNATGGISSDSISEADIMDGLYNDAAVTLIWVNWKRPTDNMIVLTGNIGQITRTGNGFQAELRSLAHRLSQVVGRVYSRTCDALLGDSRCKKDISGVAFRGPATVLTQGSSRSFAVSGLGSYTAEWFSAGLCTFQSGENSGTTYEIKRHSKNAASDQIELWDLPGGVLAPGDSVLVVAGCKKDILTCFQKFNNVVNFRGFNLIPGTDIITAYPTTTGGLRGGSLFNNV